MEETLKQCCIISSILLEIFKKESNNELFPIHCYSDNKFLLDSVYSTKEKTLKEKRLKVEICIIWERVDKGEIESINWCSSEKQLFDSLTKASASGIKLLGVLNGEKGMFQTT